MNIVIVCKSHTLGGAAVVSYRLMNALRAEGHDARMLVLSSPSEQYVSNYSNLLLSKVDFLAERLQIFLNNGMSRSRLFLVDTASWGADISGHPWVKAADVININWINQGAMSLKSIQRLALSGKKIVWTMHDMWNCTGICHHAYECRKYMEACGDCQYLGTMASKNDLAARTQRRKAQLYAATHIRFVAVSNWLADCCRRSSLMRNAHISVIPNAFPVEKFAFVRQLNRYGSGKTVLIMGAARLDDQVKGFDTLIEVTKYIRTNNPELAEKCHLVLFGGIRNAALLGELALPHTYVGSVSGDQLNDLYTQADVVLSTSHYETLPGTLVEGLASGCLAVCFGNGGQADIVDHKASGYIAMPEDVADFANGVEWAVNMVGVSRKSLHERMNQRFSAQSVAERYIELFEKE